MRIAEDKERCFLICRFLFKILIVNGIVSICVDQIGANRLAVAGICRIFKICIGWGQEKNLFIRFADILNHLKQSRDNTVGHYQFFAVECPVVFALAPCRECVIIALLKNSCVTENTLFQSLFNSVDDNIRCGKLHIRHPHTDKLFILIRKFHCLIRMEDIVTETIRVHCIRMTSVNDLIKIIHIVFLAISLFLL